MSYVLVEYECPACGRFESLEGRPAPKACNHPCGRVAHYVISAVKFKPKYGTVATGKSEEPRSVFDQDTRPLAEGMPVGEWRAKRRAAMREASRKGLNQTSRSET